jgi:hypothetical protein
MARMEACDQQVVTEGLILGLGQHSSREPHRCCVTLRTAPGARQWQLRTVFVVSEEQRRTPRQARHALRCARSPVFPRGRASGPVEARGSGREQNLLASGRGGRVPSRASMRFHTRGRYGRGARFRARANLEGARFRARADLKDARFRARADLKDARFRARADLKGARFRARAKLGWWAQRSKSRTALQRQTSTALPWPHRQSPPRCDQKLPPAGSRGLIPSPGVVAPGNVGM